MELNDVKQAYIDKMKSRLYGLLKKRKKGGQWEKFLDTILIELEGYKEDQKTINFYLLYSKLAACRYLSFKYYRKTIFYCINLFDRIDV